jgi:hypothetical protein
MMQKVLLSALALTVGLSVAAFPAPTAAEEVRERSRDGESARARRVRYGPYATIRRANEVANYYRRRGFNARVIYGGTLENRVYYVDVW